jgi:hypothetical protein
MSTIERCVKSTHSASSDIETCFVTLPAYSSSGDCTDRLESGESCTPLCRDGYTLDAPITCEDDSPARRSPIGVASTSRCIPRSCQPNDNLANGALGVCSNVLMHGEECSPECNDGYYLAHTAKCHLGTLRPPLCSPQSCTIDEPPTNGSKGDCPARLKHGDACQPACDDGYELSDVSRCQFGVLVQSTCTPQSCSAVEPPAHGDLGSCPTSLQDGESCTPWCHDGYQIVGETVCDHGKLVVASCKPAECELSAFIPDEFRGNCPANLEHGESCQPACADAGDEPVDLSVCDHGQMIIPECRPKSCSLIDMPLNSSPGDCCDTLLDGESCTPKCPKGHTITSNLRCDRGEYELPECKPDACDVRRPTHGNWGNCSPTIAHDESCQPGCEIGYEPKGIVHCQYGSTGGDFRCTPKSCTKPNPPSNGAVGACSADLQDGESCAPSCEDGYELVTPTTCNLGDISPGICLPQSCTTVSPPKNGARGNCPTTLGHGQKCQMDCRDGYRSSGDTTCALGQTRPSECVPKSCAILNGTPGHVDCPTELEHGASCSLTCPNGHVASSDTTCSFGKLSIGRCVPNDCETPRSIPHGNLGTCEAYVPHGKNCTPKCDGGHTLSEPMSCTAGQLTLSRCVPNDCTVSDPENATSGDCHPILAHGATCSPECDVGYTLSGSTTTCTSGKLTLAKCTATQCPFIVAPTHGNAGNCPTVLENGQSCAIQCDHGYQPVGLTKCVAGDLTIASCEPTACDTLPTVAHGRLGTCPSNRRLVHGESCKPECDDGFSLHDSTLCTAGNLTVGKCRANSCDVISPPDNGRMGDCESQLESGERCTPACNDGYTLSGTTNCSLGRTTVAKCVPLACDMAAPENGTIGDCNDTLHHGEHCDPKCNDGYVKSSGHASCHAGTLSTPTCTPKSCEMIIPQYGANGDCPTVLQHLDACSPACERGYTLDSKTSCQLGTLAQSTCEPKSCTGVKAPEHGNIGNCSCTLAHGATCMVECDTGYTPSHPTECNLGELTESRCLPDCCTILPPTNGAMGACKDTMRSGEVCIPKCNEGFTLQAPTTCSAGRVTASVCVPDACRVTIPDHGQQGDCSTVLESGGVCRPTCEDGYILKYPTHCVNGKLTASVCEPNSCVVSSPVNGDKGDCPDSLDHGKTCKPACQEGYTLSNLTTCDKGVGHKSLCLPKSCQVDIRTIPNAVPGNCATMIKDGDACRPVCTDGYELQGEVMCEKGALKEPFAMCRASACTNPTVPEHGTKGLGWKDPLPSGESNLVECVDGYAATNHGKLTCDKGVLWPPVACEPKSCTNESAPSNRQKPMSVFSDQSNKINCDDGYVAAGGRTIVYGSRGQSCKDVCASKNMSCDSQVQATTATYGKDIFANSGRELNIRPGTNGNNGDGWDALDGRVSNYATNYCSTVPGIWIERDGRATYDWKMSNNLTCHSSCDSTWADMARVCTCSI